MATTRELRRRIRSIRSIRQVTKAMELVSSAKMRRASEAALQSRVYSRAIRQVVEDILAHPLDNPEGTPVHPLLATRPVRRVIVVAIASDRSLAGAYNASAIKRATAFAVERQNKGQEVSFITWGRKMEQAVLRLGYPILQSYPTLPTRPTPADVWPLAASLATSYLNSECDEVLVISTDFVSILRQESIQRTLLPLATLDEPNMEKMAVRGEFIYEPGPVAVLDALLPRLLEVQLYQALVESLASEHAARRMAMKSATDNANDLIADYTLTYNGLRQGAITQEIAEVTGGAAALGA